MRPIKDGSFYLIRKLWYALALLLVLLALVVTAARYVLPRLGDYQHKLVEIIEQRYDVELEVEQISARWSLTGPELVLNGVELQPPQRPDNALSFEQLSLEADIWGSILARQPRVRQLSLNGFTLALQSQEEQTPAQLSLQELAASIADALAVFEQIQIANAQLLWQRTDGSLLEISLPELLWRTEGASFVGEGRIAPGKQQQPVSFQARLSSRTPLKGPGELFIESDGLDLRPWLKRWLPSHDWQQAVFAGRSWISWHDSQLQHARLILDDSALVVGQAALPSLSGQLRLQQLSETSAHAQKNQDQAGLRWQLEGSQLTLLDGLTTQIKFEQQPEHWLGYVSGVPLEQLAELALASGMLPEQSANTLEALQPQGQLHQVKFAWDPAAKQLLGLSGQAEELGWQRWQQLPGLHNLSGNFAWDSQQGQAKLTVHDSVLDSGMFEQPLELTALQTQLQLSRQSDSGWRLSVPELAVVTPDLSLNTQFELWLPNEGSPELYMYGELMDLLASDAEKYFPVTVMPEFLVDYLKGSLLGGHIDRANLLFSGPVKNFPFTDGSGIFQVYAPLRNANFDFDPFTADQGWPSLNPLSLDLLFTDASLLMQGQPSELGVAMMQRTIVSALRAEIPYLGKGATLYINTEVDADGRQLEQLLLDSPVRDPVGEALAKFQVSGRVTGDLDLVIPLVKRADGSADPVSVKGRAVLNNNPVNMVDLGIRLEQASGEVKFDNARIRSSAIDAELLGQPVVVAFDGQPERQGYQTNVNLRASWQVDPLKRQWPNPILDRLDGEFTWDGAVKVYSAQSKHQYKATISSNLFGLSTDLPWEDNKPAKARWPLQVNVDGDLQSGEVSIDVAKRVRAQANLIRLQDKLVIDRASLALGYNAPLLPPQEQRSWLLSAKYNQVDMQPWLSLIIDLFRSIEQPANSKQDAPAMLPPLAGLQLESGRLTLIDGLYLDNVRLTGSPSDDSWLLRLRGDQTNTRIRLEQGEERLALNIDSDFIQLAALEPGAELQSGQETATESVEVAPGYKSELQPGDLPQITFRCLDCKLGLLDLGRVSFQLQPTAQQADLTVAVDAGSTRLQANGQWQKRAEAAGNAVSWRGDFYTRRVDNFIASLGRQSVVRDSDADINFNLRWRGTPWQLDLATLDGQINWHLGEGLIVEVSDKGARVFSLLSLDSLRRKLALDFRDVFSKGLFYTKMDGRLVLDKGTAYSTDTTMDGMAGDLDIRGWVNFNTQEINYDLTFAPKVTSSLPVITAFAITPVTGVVVYALSKAFEPVVNVVTQIRFKATGTVDNPKIEEVSRSRGEVKVTKDQLPPNAQQQAE